jgi:hypothetical protein
MKNPTAKKAAGLERFNLSSPRPGGAPTHERGQRMRDGNQRGGK